MSEERKKMYMILDEVNKAQKLILECIELNGISNLTSFGALSLLSISVAIEGEMRKDEYIDRLSRWWDSAETFKEEKGPS